MTPRPNIQQIFLEHVTNNPDRLILWEDDRKLTYREFSEYAQGVARALERFSLKTKFRALLELESYVDFFPALFGVWALGGVAVPLNMRLPAPQQASIIDRISPDIVISAKKSERSLPFLDVRDVTPVQGAPRSPAASSGEAVIMFTSGSTGKPKGVPLSFESILGNNIWTSEVLGIGPDDRIFINTPAYYISGISHFFTLMSRGGSLAGCQGFFFGEKLLETMKDMGCTGFGGAPAHLVRVVGALKEPATDHGLRFWVSSGDHLSEAMIHQVFKMLPGVTLYNIYGLTEVAGRLCIMPTTPGSDKVGSVGRPMGAMQVRVLGEDGEDAPAGEVGSIRVKGPLLATGYLDREPFGPEGFNTGDLGQMDDAGNLWVRGRLDDIVKVGGEKVSLIQIQNALMQLEKIKDATVLVEESKVMGKSISAFVVSEQDGDWTRAGLMKRLKAMLPATSMPSRIIIVHEIPRTGSGKALRAELGKLL